MIKPNNSRIDPEQLNAKTAWLVAHRRRAQPLIVPVGGRRIEARQSLRLSALKSFLKGIPVMGPLLARTHRLWRECSSPGLDWRTRVRLLPGVGAFAYWAYSVLRLGRFRAHTMDELGLLRQHNETLRHRLESYRAESMTSAGQLGSELARLDNDLTRFDKQLGDRLADLTLAVRSLERRPVQALMPATTEESAKSVAEAGGGALLRSFYLAFENHFRGDRESVKSRLRPYLPYLASLPSGGSPLRVLDIGCGRGEWLELLTELGHVASGVDLDAEMAEHCRAQGFAVEQGDAIAYLSRLPSESLDVVSAFHVIEHLPLEVLVALFDEILRVLRPTGMAIFETPNPENLQVGACNFYYDPTHRHPIPPPVAEFMASQRGFAKTAILRLNPYPESHHVAMEGELARCFNDLMFGPQDYALLAWKRHEN